MKLKKVFCIGFHKTGTSSMAQAFKKLGYRVTGPNGVRDPNISNNVLNMIERLVNDFDFFQDNPWPILYKELDEKYPDSKFILTIRDNDSWIRSVVNHFGNEETPMRKWIYGVGRPKGNEDIYLKKYTSHNAEVLEYFKKRSNDFLVMDLSNGDGWNKLCPFLGVEILSSKFPHANKGKSRFKKVQQKLINSLKSFLLIRKINF